MLHLLNFEFLQVCKILCGPAKRLFGIRMKEHRDNIKLNKKYDNIISKHLKK